MQFLVAFLVILSISSAALYDYSASAAHERLDKKGIRDLLSASIRVSHLVLPSGDYCLAYEDICL